MNPKIILVICIVIISLPFSSSAQGPRGKDFGFGIVIGEPLGLTAKYWISNENSLAANVGSSFFGYPRLDVIYMWDMSVFNSDIVKLETGIGPSLGFGRSNSIIFVNDRGRWWYRNDETGFGIDTRFGINIIPRKTPLEIFLNIGLLVGFTPNFGAGVESSIGLRFYP